MLETSCGNLRSLEQGLGGRNGLSLRFDGNGIRWFPNTYSWIVAGSFLFFWFAFLAVHLRVSLDAKSAFVKTLDFIVFCTLVIIIMSLIATLYFTYPTRFGWSNEGIHLRYLNRIDILHWNTIKSIRRAHPSFGGTMIIQLGERKCYVGMVSNEIFDEIHEEMKKHRTRLIRRTWN